MDIKTVNIIGSGNVAHFLANTFFDKVLINNVVIRKDSLHSEFSMFNPVNIVSNVESLTKADLTIIAVSDDAIASVAEYLDHSWPIVHTSGSVGLTVLKGFKNAGVFYPLQTLTKAEKVNGSEIPFLIEASNKGFEHDLIAFGKEHFSEKTIKADSEQREKIHLAAVLVNNFTTLLYQKAEQILNESNLDLDILYPLIEETARKSIAIGPSKALTGPAKRGDQRIIEKHLASIKDDQLNKLYKLISEMIADKS